MEDRRQSARCPVCSGPVKALENGEQKCRNSLCSFNHKQTSCPRCSSQDIDVLGTVADNSDTYEYSCRDCQNRWQSS
jgi:hypothetical protein